MICPLCGAESVGKSTLSGMEVFRCQSSQGPGGMARSEICRQREPLYKALEQFYYFEGDGLKYVTPLGWKDAPDLEEWIKNREVKNV